MLRWRCDGMDRRGQSHVVYVEAASSEDAQEQARQHGLFVTGVKRTSSVAPLTDLSLISPDDHSMGGADRRRPQRNIAFEALIVVVAVLGVSAGVAGVVESFLFARGAVRADARVVGRDRIRETNSLVFETASGEPHRVKARGAWGFTWSGNHAIGGRRQVLYPPDRPDDARLAGYLPQYAAPLVLLAIGLVCLPFALTLLKNHWHRSPESE
ncbi:MAG: DUF3592 domain-containing protein [Planctomycetota bacterium]|nr:hypothetical protein [Planctomycetaceae bacterium]MDQ3332539.1 DUF3592 domain-containing protein [Planctomycetota bacterium]